MRTCLKLCRIPGSAKSLLFARTQYPFPLGYRPSASETLFDDIIFIFTQHSELSFMRNSPSNNRASFVEWCIDGECSFIQITDDVVLNRLEAIAMLDNSPQ